MSRQKIDACVYFIFKIANILFLAGTLTVAVRVAGTADTHGRIELFNMLHKLGCMRIIRADRTVLGHIAAQRHDIFKACRLESFQHDLHLFLRARHAGQVGQYFHVTIRFERLGDVDGEVRRAAAGTVRDGHEVGRKACNGCGVFLRGFKYFFRLGREYFK